MMSLKIRELWLEWVAVCKKALLKCKLQICKICGTDAALTTALGITIWREFLFSLTSPLCTTTTKTTSIPLLLNCIFCVNLIGAQIKCDVILIIFLYLCLS